MTESGKELMRATLIDMIQNADAEKLSCIWFFTCGVTRGQAEEAAQ